MKDGKQNLKAVLWVGSSKRDLLVMPKKVVTNFGYAIYQAQIGAYPDIAKPLKGFGGANVIELVENYKSDTFRAVYTVQFSEIIIVLHAFQKKSKKGIATPNQEIELIKNRLKRAKEIYQEWKKQGK